TRRPSTFCCAPAGDCPPLVRLCGDVIRGPDEGGLRGAGEWSLAMCAIQPGAVRSGSTPPSSSPIPIPCKIPIPCFVSQFPLKNSQFRYTGNFAGKYLELLTD